jgi:hypothetical protein
MKEDRIFILPWGKDKEKIMFSHCAVPEKGGTMTSVGFTLSLRPKALLPVTVHLAIRRRKYGGPKQKIIGEYKNFNLVNRNGLNFWRANNAILQKYKD